MQRNFWEAQNLAELETPEELGTHRLDWLNLEFVHPKHHQVHLSCQGTHAQKKSQVPHVKYELPQFDEGNFNDNQKCCGVPFQYWHPKCNDVSYCIIVCCRLPFDVWCHDYVRKICNFFIGWWATHKVRRTIMEGKRSDNRPSKSFANRLVIKETCH
jgi:hypothetical protein